jgi:hypothetical protein
MFIFECIVKLILSQFRFFGGEFKNLSQFDSIHANSVWYWLSLQQWIGMNWVKLTKIFKFTTKKPKLTQYEFYNAFKNKHVTIWLFFVFSVYNSWSEQCPSWGSTCWYTFQYVTRNPDGYFRKLVTPATNRGHGFKSRSWPKKYDAGLVPE